MPKPKRPGTISKPMNYPPIDLSRLTIKLKLKAHHHPLPKCTADKHNRTCASHGPWVDCYATPPDPKRDPKGHCICWHLNY
jgi:hypothetical protein